MANDWSNPTQPSAALPPGYQFDRATITASVTITGTTVGSPTTIIDGNAVTYDGLTEVLIEFWCPDVQVSSAGQVNIMLVEGSTEIGHVPYASNGGSGTLVPGGIIFRRFRTPAAGSLIYHVQAYKSGTVTVDAGNGVGDNVPPAYLRVTKA